MTCIVCGRRPAEVPDREAQGSTVKRVCRECHGERLAGDLRRALKESLRRRLG